MNFIFSYEILQKSFKDNSFILRRIYIILVFNDFEFERAPGAQSDIDELSFSMNVPKSFAFVIVFDRLTSMVSRRVTTLGVPILCSNVNVFFM